MWSFMSAEVLGSDQRSSSGAASNTAMPLLRHGPEMPLTDRSTDRSVHMEAGRRRTNYRGIQLGRLDIALCEGARHYGVAVLHDQDMAPLDERLTLRPGARNSRPATSMVGSLATSPNISSGRVAPRLRFGKPIDSVEDFRTCIGGPLEHRSFSRFPKPACP